MKKLINSILFYGKIILLLIAATLTLYIIFSMNDYYRRNVINILFVAVPLFLILLFFVLSLFKDEIKDNLLFNIASILGVVAIIIIDYRTIFDRNMVLWIDSQMNFYFFNNALRGIKIISYLILMGNIMLFLHKRKT